ncbi:MAG: ADP-ribosylglycohydrolase family protein [Clostridia bacterium]|nr:ADP-ribosylglycohydrolase family protein [Clostridia bacterium]
MLGAIIGDVVGSRFEFSGKKNKNFELFSDYSRFTDDTVMTCAVAKALLDCKGDYEELSERAVRCMQALGQKYEGRGYGGMFLNWLYATIPSPYRSYGNGSAMRVSPVAYAAKSPDEVKLLSRKVTEISHNHPEGIKGAEAVAMATYLALNGKTKDEIREEIVRDYYTIKDNYDVMPFDFLVDATCQGTVPPSLYAFFISDSFEDAIRTAVAFGGDADTMAAITGSVAGAYYGIPADLEKKTETYLDPYLCGILKIFKKAFM